MKTLLLPDAARGLSWSPGSDEVSSSPVGSSALASSSCRQAVSFQAGFNEDTLYLHSRVPRHCHLYRRPPHHFPFPLHDIVQRFEGLGSRQKPSDGIASGAGASVNESTGRHARPANFIDQITTCNLLFRVGGVPGGWGGGVGEIGRAHV